jgi:hypothetical protein
MLFAAHVFEHSGGEGGGGRGQELQGCDAAKANANERNSVTIAT